MTTQDKLADYVLVPRVPTEAMFDAGVERHRPQNMSAARLRLIWDAMLSAAPVQPPANGEAHGVVDAERERCAQVCESFGGNGLGYIDDDWSAMCAAAIRAR